MTLSTDIYVQGDVPAREVFEFVLTCMLMVDESQRDRAAVVEDFTPTCFGTQLGQGLPAILTVTYKPGTELRTEAQAAEHEYCNVPGYEYYDADEPDCDGTGHEPPCRLEVNLDTAYGYHSPDGYGCGDLHAALVGALGKRLDELSIPWAWKNEFTGEIHGGPDRFERLLDLASGGFEAAAWFRTTVLPVIAAEITRGGTS